MWRSGCVAPLATIRHWAERSVNAVPVGVYLADRGESIPEKEGIYTSTDETWFKGGHNSPTSSSNSCSICRRSNMSRPRIPAYRFRSKHQYVEQMQQQHQLHAGHLDFQKILDVLPFANPVMTAYIITSIFRKAAEATTNVASALAAQFPGQRRPLQLVILQPETSFLRKTILETGTFAPLKVTRRTLLKHPPENYYSSV